MFQFGHHIVQTYKYIQLNRSRLLEWRNVLRIHCASFTSIWLKTRLKIIENVASAQWAKGLQCHWKCMIHSLLVKLSWQIYSVWSEHIVAQTFIYHNFLVTELISANKNNHLHVHVTATKIYIFSYVFILSQIQPTSTNDYTFSIEFYLFE